MSKSDPDPASRILITDSADEIRTKIKRAKTDSIPGPLTYDPETRPGVSNLIDILKHVTRSSKTQQELAKEHKDTTLGALKALVADEVVKELDGIKERYEALTQPESEKVDFAMQYGRQLAGAIAGETMRDVRRAVGLDTVGKKFSTKGRSLGEHYGSLK